MLHQTCCVF